MPSSTSTSEATPSSSLRSAPSVCATSPSRITNSGFASLDRARQRIDDPAGQRGQAGVGGRAAPAKGQRHLRLPLDDIEPQQVIANGRRDRDGIDRLAQDDREAGSPAGSCAATARRGSKCRRCCPTAARCTRTRRARWRGCTRPPAGAETESAPPRVAARIVASETAAEVAEVASPRARRRIRPRRPRTSRPRMPPIVPNGSVSHRPSTSGGARILPVSAATSASAIHAVTRVSSASLTMSPRLQSQPGKRGQPLAGRIEAREATVVVDHRQATAEVDRRRVHDVAVVHERRASWCRRRCRC